MTERPKLDEIRGKTIRYGDMLEYAVCGVLFGFTAAARRHSLLITKL